MSNDAGDGKISFAEFTVSYSSAEKKFLFPVLCIVWIMSKLTLMICKHDPESEDAIHAGCTTVVPNNNAVPTQGESKSLEKSKEDASRETRIQYGADSEEYKTTLSIVQGSSSR